MLTEQELKVIEAIQRAQRTHEFHSVWKLIDDHRTLTAALETEREHSGVIGRANDKLAETIADLKSALQASKTDYDDMREAWKEDQKRITMLCDNQRELQAQRDEKAQWVTELQAKLAQALAVCNDDLTKIQALTSERDELSATLEMMSAAGLRAVRMWREAHPDADIWPDQASNQVWLMERVEALKKERDAALDEVIEMVSQHCATGTGGVVYHTFALSANESAMNFLVKMGLMTKHKGGYTFSGEKLAALAAARKAG
jgi:chromosome segregation ATPase